VRQRKLCHSLQGPGYWRCSVIDVVVAGDDDDDDDDDKVVNSNPQES
jgi:hypothetical protein